MVVVVLASAVMVLVVSAMVVAAKFVVSGVRQWF